MLDNLNMSSKNRRERHKANLKRAILEAALQIILEEGFTAFTIRRVAESIEYSVPTIYEFFESKEAILQELQILWVRDSLKVFQEIYALHLSPEESLKKSAIDYCLYAHEKPTIYQAIIRMEATSEQNPAYSQILTIGLIIKEWLQELFKKNKKQHVDLEDAVDIYRAILHGFISLHIGNKLSGDVNRFKHLVQQTLESLLASWKK